MSEVVCTPLMRDLVASHEPAFERVKHLFDQDVTYRDLFDHGLTHEQQFLLLQLLSLLAERGEGRCVGATG